MQSRHRDFRVKVYHRAISFYTGEVVVSLLSNVDPADSATDPAVSDQSSAESAAGFRAQDVERYQNIRLSVQEVRCRRHAVLLFDAFHCTPLLHAVEDNIRESSLLLAPVDTNERYMRGLFLCDRTPLLASSPIKC